MARAKAAPGSGSTPALLSHALVVGVWYAAFGVKEGDALYLPPDKRSKIW